MKIEKLLDGVEIIKVCVDKETHICDIVSDSRNVGLGSVFVAIYGEKRDGNDYICNAMEHGAALIVSEKDLAPNIPHIKVKNARQSLAVMCSNYYGNPTKDMKVIAVTGTNGKTSTAWFIYNILISAGKNCGLISTVGCMINRKEGKYGGGGATNDICSAMTTPEPEVLYKIFYDMKRAGCEYIVTEASSHSISQHRLDGTHIDAGIFTNLSLEHLDFHKSIENYFNTKLSLFEKCKFAIINADDEYGKRVYEKYRDKSVLCSINDHKGVYADKIESDENGTRYVLFSDDATVRINSVICGKYTVYNTMLAAMCCMKLGIFPDYISDGIRFTERISGRLERYKGLNIYIDYAHTPYAMENVIKSVRAFSKNKKITVLFGCGGDRDKSKRAEMGKIASELADKTVITSDNSRSEDKNEIIKDILVGIEKDKTHFIIPDRREAIIYAVKSMRENEILLLLGKGHETYEISKDGKRHFDEREIIEEALSEK